MRFTVTYLGTASAKPVRERNQSAQVLCVRERFFLMDCGEGTQREMARCHIPMQRIDSVFISHVHGDHVFGLPGLLSTMGMEGRTEPLQVFGPANLGPILNFFLSYYGEGLAFEIRFTPLKMKEPEVILSSKNVEVLAFPLRHGIDTYGYIFREKEPLWNVRKDAVERLGLSLTEIGTLKQGGDVVRPDGTVLSHAELAYKPFIPRSYAYCSDTAVFPEERQFLRGVRFLYHEATFLQEHADNAYKRFHSTTLEVARLAAELGVEHLYIGHFSSRNRDGALYEAECRTLFPATTAVNDGDVVEFPFEKAE